MAIPLKNTPVANRLVEIAARRAASKITEAQRQKLDQLSAKATEKAGETAEAALMCAWFTLAPSAMGTIETFGTAAAMFAADPLPAVDDDDFAVSAAAILKIIRVALDLGDDAGTFINDIGRMAELYRAAYRAAGEARDFTAGLVDRLPDEVAESVTALGVVERFRVIAYELISAKRRWSAEDYLAAIAKRPARQRVSQEDHEDELADVLVDVAIGQAGIYEVLSAVFWIHITGDLFSDAQKAVRKVGIARATEALKKMVAAMPAVPVNPVTISETFAFFSNLATPRARAVEVDPEAVW